MARPKKIEKSVAAPVASPKDVIKPHSCEPSSFAFQGMSVAAGQTDTFLRSDTSNQYITNQNILKYNNLFALQYPFDRYSGGFINLREIVRLCQTAYNYVSIFRNTIELMVSVANTDIVLRGGNDESNQFFQPWLKKVCMKQVAEQCFRECWRSSNVFFYRLDGGIKSNKIKRFAEASKNNDNLSEAARTIDIPLKYVLLNPADICTFDNMGLDNDVPAYFRMIDASTRSQLRDLIKNGSVNIDTSGDLGELLSNDTLSQYRLDPDHLLTMFFNKQDYEPFSMPAFFPVLEDINIYLEFKKADMVVAKTIENLILLVTHGDEQEKGGMNPLVDKALKEIFKSKQPGRVVVSDYTTKMEFIIPDLNKILGEDKYNQVNSDIRDGLMSIMTGNDKFSSAVTKLRLFVKRLDGVRELFLDRILNPEIKRIAKLIGYDDYPTAEFEKIQLEDSANGNRVIAQLMQLGILTPKYGLQMMETGIMPDMDQLVDDQKEYCNQRDQGMWYPLVGGSMPGEDDVPGGEGKVGGGGRPPGKGIKQTITRNTSPQGSTSKAFEDVSVATEDGDIPAAITTSYNIDKLIESVMLVNKTNSGVESAYKKLKRKKRLSQTDKIKMNTILSNIVLNEEPSQWESKVQEYVSGVVLPKPERLIIQDSIKSQHEGISDFSASLLAWSKYETSE